VIHFSYDLFTGLPCLLINVGQDVLIALLFSDTNIGQKLAGSMIFSIITVGNGGTEACPKA
jgi:hypothetical protein